MSVATHPNQQSYALEHELPIALCSRAVLAAPQIVSVSRLAVLFLVAFLSARQAVASPSNAAVRVAPATSSGAPSLANQPIAHGSLRNPTVLAVEPAVQPAEPAVVTPSFDSGVVVVPTTVVTKASVAPQVLVLDAGVVRAVPMVPSPAMPTASVPEIQPVEDTGTSPITLAVIVGLLVVGTIVSIGFLERRRRTR